MPSSPDGTGILCWALSSEAMEGEAPVSRPPSAGLDLTDPLADRLPWRECCCAPDSLTGQAHGSHHPCTDVRRNSTPETETRHSGSAASAALQASCQSQWG